MIKDSGDRTQFSSGAVRDMHGGKGRMDLLPWQAIIEVSKHCEEGALKYGEHNVDKGIPLHSFYDSAMRHLAKHLSGMTDERHDIAAAWNILWAIQTAITHPELVDVPWKEPEQTKADSTEQTATVPCETCRYAGNSVEPCTWCVYCGGDKDAPSYWQPKQET